MGTWHPTEAELTESAGADERLLTLLGLRGQHPSAHPPQSEGTSGKARVQLRRPGKRGPARDSLEEVSGGETIHLSAEEQVAR